jgi:hypothetical protein
MPEFQIDNRKCENADVLLNEVDRFLHCHRYPSSDMDGEEIRESLQKISQAALDYLLVLEIEVLKESICRAE